MKDNMASFLWLCSPVSPDKMDWSEFYPNLDKFGANAKVEFADIGCGYGGLLGNIFIHLYYLPTSSCM